MKVLINYLISGVLLLTPVTICTAGSNCKNSADNPQIYRDAIRQGIALNKDLKRSGAQVALVARVGSDISKYGMYYTHVGIAVKDFPGRRNKWTMVHLINKCGTAQSAIHAQGLAHFFLEDLYNTDYQISLLDPETQERLNRAIRTSLVKEVHEAHYSMLAYPFATDYQNSNQWVLEFIEAADSGQNSRSRIQQLLQEKGYKPSIIAIGRLTQWGASLFKANVRFDDHPLEEQNTYSYSTVTVDSILQYLEKQGKIIKNIERRGG